MLFVINYFELDRGGIEFGLLNLGAVLIGHQVRICAYIIFRSFLGLFLLHYKNNNLFERGIRCYIPGIKI